MAGEVAHLMVFNALLFPGFTFSWALLVVCWSPLDDSLVKRGAGATRSQAAGKTARERDPCP
ncbi:hypothetical protein [Streptomyces neyagawaensis]|uniref:Uncharacterized protein n=1 Tax=Streptomyces neyagawaensis TaxID=42238 RepID=A0ABV3ATT6_9ACTN